VAPSAQARPITHTRAFHRRNPPKWGGRPAGHRSPPNNRRRGRRATPAALLIGKFKEQAIDERAHRSSAWPTHTPPPDHLRPADPICATNVRSRGLADPPAYPRSKDTTRQTRGWWLPPAPTVVRQSHGCPRSSKGFHPATASRLGRFCTGTGGSLARGRGKYQVNTRCGADWWPARRTQLHHFRHRTQAAAQILARARPLHAGGQRNTQNIHNASTSQGRQHLFRHGFVALGDSGRGRHNGANIR